MYTNSVLERYNNVARNNSLGLVVLTVGILATNPICFENESYSTIMDYPKKNSFNVQAVNQCFFHNETESGMTISSNKSLSTQISQLDIIERKYQIDDDVLKKMRLFSSSFNSLINLKKIIIDELGHVSARIDTFSDNNELCLMVNIEYNGDIFEGMDKLEVIEKKWIAKHDYEVIKNIYMDLVV